MMLASYVIEFEVALPDTEMKTSLVVEDYCYLVSVVSHGHSMSMARQECWHRTLVILVPFIGHVRGRVGRQSLAALGQAKCRRQLVCM